MARVAVVCDVHVGPHRRHAGPTVVGVNSRCRAVLDTLRRAVARAREMGCGVFAVAGDLLDVARPTPQLLAEVQRILEPMPCVLLLGNHEQVSAAQGDHALGPLAPVSTVVDEPRAIAVPGPGRPLDLLCVPFEPYPAHTWLRRLAKLAAAKAREGSDRVLLVHLGISDGDTAWFLKNAHDSIPVDDIAAVAKEVGARTVIAGNWHAHRRWKVDGVDVVQVGTLCPTGYRDGGMDDVGFMAVHDSGAAADPPWNKRTHNSTTLERIPGPRFVQIRALADVASVVRQAKAAGADPLYVEATVPAADVEPTREVLDGLVQAGTVAAYDALSTASTATRTAESAAAEGAAADGDDPIAAYVQAMDLPPGVAGADVLAEVRGLLVRSAG